MSVEAPGRYTVTWSLAVKLTDVDKVRRLATQASCEETDLIADSFPVAWQRAADAFAPLRSIPGITRRPVQVDVEHLPARRTAGVP